MNRRSFLGILTAGLAAAADPERLLWAPRRKLISIPKPNFEYKRGHSVLVRKPMRFYGRKGQGFYPEQISPDTHWVILTQDMTREEFARRYPSSI